MRRVNHKLILHKNFSSPNLTCILDCPDTVRPQYGMRAVSHTPPHLLSSLLHPLVASPHKMDAVSLELVYTGRDDFQFSYMGGGVYCESCISRRVNKEEEEPTCTNRTPRRRSNFRVPSGKSSVSFPCTRADCNDQRHSAAALAAATNRMSGLFYTYLMLSDRYSGGRCYTKW